MLASLILLPVLALATPVVELHKRSGATITQAISYINSNITTVNGTLNTFTKPKDSITALTLQTETESLIKSVDNAASVCNASAPLSDSESYDVALSVLNLQPNINSLLDNLVAHKEQFMTALFGFSADSLVKMDLQNAKKSADNFGAALTPKLTATYQGAAPVIIQQIDAKFDDAIKAFST